MHCAGVHVVSAVVKGLVPVAVPAAGLVVLATAVLAVVTADVTAVVAAVVAPPARRAKSVHRPKSGIRFTPCMYVYATPEQVEELRLGPGICIVVARKRGNSMHLPSKKTV